MNKLKYCWLSLFKSKAEIRRMKLIDYLRPKKLSKKERIELRIDDIRNHLFNHSYIKNDHRVHCTCNLCTIYNYSYEYKHKWETISKIAKELELRERLKKDYIIKTNHLP